MTFLKKRKGKYYGEFVFDFLEKQNIFLLCHANDMHLNTCLSIRKGMDQVHFGFRFLKRKPVLKFFDEKNDLKPINELLNGSLIFVFPKKKNFIDLKIFEIISKNQNISFLGMFWKHFYLTTDFFKIYSQLKIFKIKEEEKNLFEVVNSFKFLNFTKIRHYFTLIIENYTIFNSLKFFNFYTIKKYQDNILRTNRELLC